MKRSRFCIVIVLIYAQLLSPFKSSSSMGYNKNMNIVFVTSSLANGGAERVISELASEFSKTFQVEVILTSVHQTEYYHCGSASVSYLSEFRKISPFGKIRKLIDFFKKKNPDVVIAFPDPCSFYAAFASRKNHIPCICSERNAPQFSPTGKLMRLVRYWSYRLATNIVFQTEDAKRYFPRCIQKKGVIISNPFQPHFVCSREPENLIIAIGRLTPQKNFPCLIEAFQIFHESFPNYSLEIYGDGMGKNDIEKIIACRGLSSFVFLKGFTNNLSDPFRRARMFVMSSDHEGMPNALLEAAAAGIPCVSTDCPVGGARSLIGDNAFDRLVPTKNPHLLAKAMIDIVNNYQEVEKGCILYSETLKTSLSIGRICGQWLDLIELAISPASPKKKK
jgi:GalNAc-alpha-(1->4)-GalNAc-alpha-(1->3)-diNAcBac-PP-undecaprenol alpha-1,4-N-acetyl-D-galactosaminyltransferase